MLQLNNILLAGAAECSTDKSDILKRTPNTAPTCSPKDAAQFPSEGIKFNFVKM